MILITKPELDSVLDIVFQSQKIENLTTRDSLISYIIDVYGDQWRYKRYIPVLVYILWIIYGISLAGLIYVGMNGGLVEDNTIRLGFHNLWIMLSNTTYLGIFIMILVYVYTISRASFFSLRIVLTSSVYFLIPFIGIGYSIYTYFRYGNLFQKEWAISLGKLYCSILIVPFTWWIGVNLSTFIK